jgi:hypothetical protein
MTAKRIIAVSATAAIVLLSTAAAFAQPGVATSSVNVRTGPGTGFAKVGALAAGEYVDVGDCQGSWCYVDRQSGNDGWVSANYLKPVNAQPAPQEDEDDDVPFNMGVTIGPNGPSISFGIGNQPPVAQPAPPPPAADKICFYTDIQFTGQSACVAVGANSAFLIPGWDDNIESVKIVGTGHFELCRDQNFGGGCVVYSSSRSSLPPSYANKVSSYQTYY